MKRSILVAVILILTLLLGCSPQAPVTPLPTKETPPVVAPETPALTPSPAPQEILSTPTPTPTPLPTPTGPYTGSLFDTHLHLYPMYSGTTQELASMKVKTSLELVNFLDKHDIAGAIGFHTLPTNTSARYVAARESIINDTRSRVISLLQPSQNDWADFASGQFNEQVMQRYTQPKGLCQGIGEIVLVKPALQSITFDNPQMQTVFQVVNEMKGIVMIHPSTINEGKRDTTLAEIEPSIQRYPDTIFLFHPLSNFRLVALLMAKYPNVYYSWDFLGSFYQGLGNRYPYQLSTGGTSLGSSNPDASADFFLETVDKVGLDYIVDENVKMLIPQLKEYPDRIMWGTDFNLSWHFEDLVTDMVFKISREVIGRLPADLQEKYAYKNAQRVFGRFLQSNP